MQLQGETEDLGFCLSFDCYYSDSLTASAAAKVICELKQDQQASHFYDFSDVDEDDFEFSHELYDEELSGKLRVDASPVSVDQSQKSLVKVDESYECNHPSGMFCLWGSKAGVVSSALEKFKKIGSTGSRSHGSRRWRVWKSLRWSNSEAEESVLVKKTDSSKERCQVNKREVVKVAGKMKMRASSPSFHELFYVQKRVQKDDKMKSFLPYKQDLLARVFC